MLTQKAPNRAKDVRLASKSSNIDEKLLYALSEL